MTGETIKGLIRDTENELEILHEQSIYFEDELEQSDFELEYLYEKLGRQDE